MHQPPKAQKLPAGQDSISQPVPHSKSTQGQSAQHPWDLQNQAHCTQAASVHGSTCKQSQQGKSWGRLFHFWEGPGKLGALGSTLPLGRHSKNIQGQSVQLLWGSKSQARCIRPVATHGSMCILCLQGMSWALLSLHPFQTWEPAGRLALLEPLVGKGFPPAQASCCVSRRWRQCGALHGRQHKLQGST